MATTPPQQKQQQSERQVIIMVKAFPPSAKSYTSFLLYVPLQPIATPYTTPMREMINIISRQATHTVTFPISN